MKERQDNMTDDNSMDELAFERAGELIARLTTNIGTVIRGKAECIDMVCVGLLAGGSILIEDVPGVGKTTLAKALSRSIDGQFHRIQFTPDLLPADILGSSIYNPKDGSFQFRDGPIFCNVLLADEINRASPRTQSALLEAMSEGQATIEGCRHLLPAPFMVIATQNSIEFHGTYPLPEAQLDRFLIMLDIGYPEAETEQEILFAQRESHPIDSVKPVLDINDVAALQRTTTQIRVDTDIAAYIVGLVAITRSDDRLKLGVSPRGSLMLFRTAQAYALLQGRDYVLPDDVQRMAIPVLSHRLVLNSKSRYGGIQKQDVIRELLSHVKIPR